ncbi:MAG: acylneuraminate cytidylyltransferase family protein, partial [Chloroflexi bacterium]|nr:acylneuraminate cytidylyltransferase family protein [Chloroflexota bacterium]
MPEVLALIPARGGSKSIPRKNIKPFAGHPLLAYSIAAGLQARAVTRVIVSTDDPEIAAVAQEYGAEVPFLRPAHLAQDHTPDLPVFQHALEW